MNNRKFRAFYRSWLIKIKFINLLIERNFSQKIKRINHFQVQKMFINAHLG